MAFPVVFGYLVGIVCVSIVKGVAEPAAMAATRAHYLPRQ